MDSFNFFISFEQFKELVLSKVFSFVCFSSLIFFLTSISVYKQSCSNFSSNLFTLFGSSKRGNVSNTSRLSKPSSFFRHNLNFRPSSRSFNPRFISLFCLLLGSVKPTLSAPVVVRQRQCLYFFREFSDKSSQGTLDSLAPLHLPVTFTVPTWDMVDYSSVYLKDGYPTGTKSEPSTPRGVRGSNESLDGVFLKQIQDCLDPGSEALVTVGCVVAAVVTIVFTVSTARPVNSVSSSPISSPRGSFSRVGSPTAFGSEPSVNPNSNSNVELRSAQPIIDSSSFEEVFIRRFTGDPGIPDGCSDFTSASILDPSFIIPVNLIPANLPLNNPNSSDFTNEWFKASQDPIGDRSFDGPINPTFEAQKEFIGPMKLTESTEFTESSEPVLHPSPPVEESQIYLIKYAEYFLYKRQFYKIFFVDLAEFFKFFNKESPSLDLGDFDIIVNAAKRITAANIQFKNNQRECESILYFPFNNAKEVYGPLSFVYYLSNRTDPRRFSFSGILNSEQYFFLRLEKYIWYINRKDYSSLHPLLTQPLGLSDVPWSTNRTIKELNSLSASLAQPVITFKGPCHLQRFKNIPIPDQVFYNIIVLYTQIPIAFRSYPYDTDTGSNDMGGTANGIDRKPQLLTFPTYLKQVLQKPDGLRYIRKSRPIALVIQYLKSISISMERVLAVIIEDGDGLAKRTVSCFNQKLGFSVTVSFEVYLISLLFFDPLAFHRIAGPSINRTAYEKTNWCCFWDILAESLGLLKKNEDEDTLFVKGLIGRVLNSYEISCIKSWFRKVFFNYYKGCYSGLSDF